MTNDLVVETPASLLMSSIGKQVTTGYIFTALLKEV